MRNCLLLLAVLGLTVPVWGQNAKKEEQIDLAQLVKKLGSSRYREREGAMNALLRQRTPAAVAVLYQATRHPDLEVRRRALEVLGLIERSLESETLLVPQKLRLEFKDVAITDAVADFSRRTGLKIVLADTDRAKLASRKVTLDTGREVTYWEALRQLCDTAGLSEKPPDPNARRADNPYAEMTRRGRVVWMNSYSIPTPAVDQIVLVDGKQTRSIYDAGAIRLQVLSRTGPPQMGPPGREVELSVAADIEPRFNWNRLVAIRVNQALDDRGQKLVQPTLFIGEQPNHFSYPDEMFILWDGAMEFPRAASRQGTIRLKLGEKSARTVKELRGKLAVEVEAPTAPLLTVPDILKSSGKTFKGPDGSAVKVIEARQESGQYKLQIEVTSPPNPSQMIDNRMANIIWLNRGPVAANGTVDLTAAQVQEKGLSLVDREGQPLLLVTAHHIRPAQPTAPLVYVLYYQPRKDQGEPAKFVLMGRRSVLIEVPFVLRDVPLP
jgi:hypothetical protein